MAELKAIDKKDEFGELVTTESFRTFQVMISILEKFRKEGRFACVVGPAGSGKTSSLLFWMARLGDIYLRHRSTWKKTAFLRALAKAIGIESPPKYAAACVEVIEAKLLPANKLIYVDEADKLGMDIIEALRDITDVTYCPIILAGEPVLAQMMRRNQRIWSRTAFEIVMKPLSVADIISYNNKNHGLDMTQEIAANLHNVTAGNFRDLRRMMILIEDQCRASGTKKVETKMIAIAKNTTPRA